MKVILLSRGKSALLDDEDYESIGLLGKWCPRKTDRGWCAYTIVERDKFKVTLWMHDLVAEAVLGRELKDELALNKNADKLDNRRENIEVKHISLVKKQRRLKHKQYRGISKRGEHRYLAGIRYNNTDIKIGNYYTARQAAKAYDKKAKELYGEFAQLNFKA